MKGYANPGLVTTPSALAEAQASSAPPLVIDLRPPEDFAAGHIPGAVHLDLWGVSLIDTDPAPLKAFMWMIDHLFNLRGVTSTRISRFSISSVFCRNNAPRIGRLPTTGT